MSNEEKKKDNYLHEIKKIKKDDFLYTNKDFIYREIDRHSQEFKDTLITYCDCFYDTLCNIKNDSLASNELSDKAQKQIDINAHNFIKSILDLYDNEK